MMTLHSDITIKPVNIVALKMVREKRVGYNSPICSSEDVVKLVRCLFQDSYREMVVVIGIDNSNKPTVIHTVSIGGPSQAAVSISSVYKPLLLSNSVGFILVHNHPGSTMVPSMGDKELTEKLKTIGRQLEVTMLDHIILNADSTEYYSFKMQGIM
jgi:DNA repair protein RadC